MKEKSVVTEIPTSERSTYDMLNKAFPDGINTTDYLPLLIVLHDGFSIRGLAEFIAAYLAKDYAVAYNDVLKALSADTQKNQATAVARIKQYLQAYNYEAWLAEEI